MINKNAGPYSSGEVIELILVSLDLLQLGCGDQGVSRLLRGELTVEVGHVRQVL